MRRVAVERLFPRDNVSTSRVDPSTSAFCTSPSVVFTTYIKSVCVEPVTDHRQPVTTKPTIQAREERQSATKNIYSPHLRHAQIRNLALLLPSLSTCTTSA